MSQYNVSAIEKSIPNILNYLWVFQCYLIDLIRRIMYGNTNHVTSYTQVYSSLNLQLNTLFMCYVYLRKIFFILVRILKKQVTHRRFLSVKILLNM